MNIPREGEISFMNAITITDFGVGEGRVGSIKKAEAKLNLCLSLKVSTEFGALSES
jgi:hypothetical protein